MTSRMTQGKTSEFFYNIARGILNFHYYFKVLQVLLINFTGVEIKVAV